MPDLDPIATAAVANHAVAAALVVLVLLVVAFFALETFLDEVCPAKPGRARRVARYARATMTDPKKAPANPDVISEDEVLREGARLDEGAVDAQEDRRLQEEARDRHRPDR